VEQPTDGRRNRAYSKDEAANKDYLYLFCIYKTRYKSYTKVHTNTENEYVYVYIEKDRVVKRGCREKKKGKRKAKFWRSVLECFLLYVLI